VKIIYTIYLYVVFIQHIE